MREHSSSLNPTDGQWRSKNAIALWEYINVRCFASTVEWNDETISFIELEIIALCSITSHKDMESDSLKQLRRAAAEQKRNAGLPSSRAVCIK